MSPQIVEQLDPQPFRDWVDERLGADADDAATVKRLALALFPEDTEETSARKLHRWRFENKTLEKAEVADALHHADSALWEVYGVEEIDLEDDAYCERCHDTVTPIEGVCPWCESDLREARARSWCPREDRLVFPAHDGTCWRCGAETQAIPWVDCACGCGTTIPSFDPQGRKHEFALGHAPKTEGRHHTVPVEPFARYLEAELESMDLIGALARAHGIGRDDVVRVLKRQVETLPTKMVRRAVWTAGRGGTGKGLPMRPGATSFADLYPDFVRSKVCGCGNGKAPHAEMCKACRRKVDKAEGRSTPRAGARVREELIEESYRTYMDDGVSVEAAAESIIERTTAKSAASLAYTLRREWKRRGWERRGRTTARPAMKVAA